MADDPRKAKTIGEAARNPDGTYNVWRVGAWLIAATTGNKDGPTADEVRDDYYRRKEERERGQRP